MVENGNHEIKFVLYFQGDPGVELGTVAIFTVEIGQELIRQIDIKILWCTQAVHHSKQANDVVIHR